jgi:hypothetical protein
VTVAAADAWEVTGAEVTVPQVRAAWHPTGFRQPEWRVALAGPRGLIEAEDADLVRVGALLLRKARESAPRAASAAALES